MQTYTNQRGQTFGIKKGFLYDSVVPMDRGTAFSTPQYQGLSGKSRDILMKINLGQKVSNREIRHLRGAMWVANGGNLGPEFARRASSIDPISHLRESQAAGLERARLGARQDAMYGDGASESPTLQALNRDALIAEARQRSLAEDVAAMRRDQYADERRNTEYYNKNILPIEQARMKNEALLAARKSQDSLGDYQTDRNRAQKLKSLKFDEDVSEFEARKLQKDRAEQNYLKGKSDLMSAYRASEDWFRANVKPGEPGYDFYSRMFKSGGNEEMIVESINRFREQKDAYERRAREAEAKNAAKYAQEVRRVYNGILANLRKTNNNLMNEFGKRTEEELLADAASIMENVYPDWQGIIQAGAGAREMRAEVKAFQNELKKKDKAEVDRLINQKLKNREISEEDALQIYKNLGKGK